MKIKLIFMFLSFLILQSCQEKETEFGDVVHPTKKEKITSTAPKDNPEDNPKDEPEEENEPPNCGSNPTQKHIEMTISHSETCTDSYQYFLDTVLYSDEVLYDPEEDEGLVISGTVQVIINQNISEVVSSNSKVCNTEINKQGNLEILTSNIIMKLNEETLSYSSEANAPQIITSEELLNELGLENNSYQDLNIVNKKVLNNGNQIELTLSYQYHLPGYHFICSDNHTEEHVELDFDYEFNND